MARGGGLRRVLPDRGAWGPAAFRAGSIGDQFTVLWDAAASRCWGRCANGGVHCRGMSDAVTYAEVIGDPVAHSLKSPIDPPVLALRKRGPIAADYRAAGWSEQAALPPTVARAQIRRARVARVQCDDAAQAGGDRPSRPARSRRFAQGRSARSIRSRAGPKAMRWSGYNTDAGGFRRTADRARSRPAALFRAWRACSAPAGRRARCCSRCSPG